MQTYIFALAATFSAVSHCCTMSDASQVAGETRTFNQAEIEVLKSLGMDDGTDNSQQSQVACDDDGYNSVRSDDEITDQASVAQVYKRLTSHKGFYEKRAFEQYAQEHNLDVKNVSLKMLEDNGGAMHWGYKGVDLTPRSPMVQAIMNDLKKPENKKYDNIFKYLGPALREKFIKGWGFSKTWEWVKEARTHTTYTQTSAKTRRMWVSQTQLAGILKEPLDGDQPESWAYFNNSWWQHSDTDPWIKWAAWRNVWLCNYEWEEEAEEDGERHENKNELYNCENLFEVAAKENKAIRNFAEAKQIRPGLVDISMVKSDELGVEGWANIGEPKMRGRGKATDASAADTKRELSRAKSDVSAVSAELSDSGAVIKDKNKGKKIADAAKATAKKKAGVKALATRQAAASKRSQLDKESKAVLELIDQTTAQNSVCEDWEKMVKNEDDFEVWATSLVTELRGLLNVDDSSRKIMCQIQKMRVGNDWQKKLVAKIIALYGDDSTEKLICLKGELQDVLDKSVPQAEKIQRMIDAKTNTFIEDITKKKGAGGSGIKAKRARLR